MTVMQVTRLAVPSPRDRQAGMSGDPGRGGQNPRRVIVRGLSVWWVAYSVLAEVAVMVFV